MILDDDFYRISPPRFIIFFVRALAEKRRKKITLGLTPKSDFSQSFGSVVHGLFYAACEMTLAVAEPML